MSTQIRAVVSTSTDPHVNLALENAFLESISPGRRILFLYRNRESVVIGRHQNPWIECDLAAMRNDGILLARRQSGGGAVFHDLGNTNYSILSPRKDYDDDAGFGVVLEALEGLGLEVERNERNDLVHRGRKFSGSAFRHRSGRSFQHGTLLISSDLDRLTRYLSAPTRRIEAKGTASVRSQVVNLSSVSTRVSHEAVCTAVAESFGRRYGVPTLALESIDEESIGSDVFDWAHDLRSWEWLYGKTPDFEHGLALSDGSRVVFRMHRGVVESVDVDPAGLSIEGRHPEAAGLLSAIVGCRYRIEDFCRALAEGGPRHAAEELCKMLEKEIP